MRNLFPNADPDDFPAAAPEFQICPDLLQEGKGATVDELRQAIGRAPSDWRLHYALGEALVAAGREEEAIGAYIKATQFEPKFALAYAMVGRVFLSRGLTDPARFWLRKALEVDASCECGMVSLAVVEAERGCRERVTELLDSWISADPADPIRRHLSMAILGEDTPAKASDEYVTTLFDAYAQKFDESLAGLHYSGPQLIAEALDKFSDLPPKGFNALDVGCGTGLVGEVLRPRTRLLVGVDLSQNMIQKAAERGLYDELHHDEMVSFMRSRPCQFDLLTAADVLTYCGDLNDFASAAASTLRPGGVLFAVLEAWPDAGEGKGYQLDLSGRYAHREDYVSECLLRHDFLVQAITRTSMRQSLGRPVPSLLLVAEKKLSA